MNIQIFGTKKCNDTKKAQRFFKERGIKFQFIDMSEKEISKGEFRSVCQAVGGLNAMINENCKDKDALALVKYISEDEREEKLLENQHVIKTPIVRNGKQATVGYAPDIWKGWSSSKFPRKVHKMEKDTLDYYNERAKEFVEGTVDVPFTEIQDLFLRYIPKGGKLLDFGCGSGRDTKYFLSKGYVVDATDGAEALCKIAAEYTGIPVRKMLFEELDSIEVYDGIWACASILHVAKRELPMILQKMADAVKVGGVIYASFKYGDFEGNRNGRYFTYLTEESFAGLIEEIPELTIEKTWISADVRAERGEERWLNLILTKRATS